VSKRCFWRSPANSKDSSWAAEQGAHPAGPLQLPATVGYCYNAADQRLRLPAKLARRAQLRVGIPDRTGRRPAWAMQLASDHAELVALWIAHDDVVPVPVEVDLSDRGCPRSSQTLDLGKDQWPASLQLDMPTSTDSENVSEMWSGAPPRR